MGSFGIIYGVDIDSCIDRYVDIDTASGLGIVLCAGVGLGVGVGSCMRIRVLFVNVH